MQTDPKDVIVALDIIEGNELGIVGTDCPIYVKGRRRGRPLFDTIFTVGMSFFESFVYG